MKAAKFVTKSKALTAMFVNNAKKPGKFHDGKGLGLILLVKLSGARSWIQRLMVRGKRRELGLGSPPVVTLAEAREQALQNKRLAQTGGDPLAEKRRAKSVLTFFKKLRGRRTRSFRQHGRTRKIAPHSCPLLKITSSPASGAQPCPT